MRLVEADHGVGFKSRYWFYLYQKRRHLLYECSLALRKQLYQSTRWLAVRDKISQDNHCQNLTETHLYNDSRNNVYSCNTLADEDIIDTRAWWCNQYKTDKSHLSTGEDKRITRCIPIVRFVGVNDRTAAQPIARTWRKTCDPRREWNANTPMDSLYIENNIRVISNIWQKSKMYILENFPLIEQFSQTYDLASKSNVFNCFQIINV